MQLTSFDPFPSKLTISELVNKGRLVGRDNVPSSFHEFAVSGSSESKDFRFFINQVSDLSRRIAHSVAPCLYR